MGGLLCVGFSGLFLIGRYRWKGKDQMEFLAGIKFSGIDSAGIVLNITTTVSYTHLTLPTIYSV